MSRYEINPKKIFIQPETSLNTYKNLNFEDISESLRNGGISIPKKVVNELSLDSCIWIGRNDNNSIFLAGKKTTSHSNDEISAMIKIKKRKEREKGLELEVVGYNKSGELIVYRKPKKSTHLIFASTFHRTLKG